MCPLCGQRKAKRSCPALNQQICAVCCGTKRLTQIRCPSDCTYLATARDHPPATLVRQQQRDLGLLLQFVRDFNDRQSKLFLLAATFLVRYEAPELQPIVDDDVVEATAAMAATFETASRGVIYEHRPASLPAERLASALRPLLLEAGKSGGTSFERDASVVLRRLEGAVREVRAVDQGNRRAFLDFIRRTIRKDGPTGAADELGAQEASRLILP